MDSDGQDDPEILNEIIEINKKIIESSGSRNVKNLEKLL